MSGISFNIPWSISGTIVLRQTNRQLRRLQDLLLSNLPGRLPVRPRDLRLSNPLDRPLGASVPHLPIDQIPHHPNLKSFISIQHD
jgi:hypothetical protein